MPDSLVPTRLDPDLAAWLDAEAEALDTGRADAEALVPRLGAAGLFGQGVAASLGGTGGGIGDAIEAIAALSERSLAAGFVAWSQRTFVEYLLQSPNAALRHRLLPEVLTGRLAGATALSNAMKALSGIERLQIAARRAAGGYVLDGVMPWVTNLRKQGFQVAAGIAGEDGRSFVATLPHDVPGLARSDDLALIAMQGTNTAAIRLTAVEIPADWVLADDAERWLPQVRPAFLGLQCGLSIGLARRALAEAEAVGGDRGVLAAPRRDLLDRLAGLTRRLVEGVADGRFQTRAAPLFESRIALADLALEAVALELQASGGRAYLTSQPLTFARRWREAAFLPIVTPSLSQLKAALATQPVGAAA